MHAVLVLQDYPSTETIPALVPTAKTDLEIKKK